MSQLILSKIDHIEKELQQLREMVNSSMANEPTLFEPQGLNDIYEFAYSNYKVRKEQVLGKSRKFNVLAVRQIVCYFLNHIRGYNLNEIASLTGYKDHSTVLHSVRRVKLYLEIKDPKFMLYYNNFKHLLV